MLPRKSQIYYHLLKHRKIQLNNRTKNSQCLPYKPHIYTHRGTSTKKQIQFQVLCSMNMRLEIFLHSLPLYFILGQNKKWKHCYQFSEIILRLLGIGELTLLKEYELFNSKMQGVFSPMFKEMHVSAHPFSVVWVCV